MWDKKKSKKTKHKKTKTNNSNILCNEHRAEFPLTVFSAIIQTRLYLLHSNVDIYLDKCTRVKSFSYMENRQTEENILSEYQKYSLTKKIQGIMQEISAFFYFPFWMKVFRLFRWILYRIVFNQIHVCQLFLDSIKDDIVYLCLKKKLLINHRECSINWFQHHLVK